MIRNIIHGQWWEVTKCIYSVLYNLEVLFAYELLLILEVVFYSSRISNAGLLLVFLHSILVKIQCSIFT